MWESMASTPALSRWCDLPCVLLLSGNQTFLWSQYTHFQVNTPCPISDKITSLASPCSQGMGQCLEEVASDNVHNMTESGAVAADTGTSQNV